MHPDEAMLLLHRGYALVDGVRQPVRFIHNEAHMAQLYVGGTFVGERSPMAFVDSALTRAA